MKTFKYYLKLFSLPLSFLFLFLSLQLIWNIFNLPSTEVLLAQVKFWFDLYGLPVLFISAFVEGMLLVGGYFPGVFVIFVSVLLANSVPQAIIAVTIGTLGLFLAHLANYALGKYGWHKLLVKFGGTASLEESKEKLIKKGPWVIFGSYWLPSMGAFTDTAAGIINMPFRTFATYALFAGIFWNSLVGSIVYVVGLPALVIVSSDGSTELMVQFAVVIIWMVVLLAMDIWKKFKIKSD